MSPRVLVGLQRVRLPVAAVQREHQLRAQPLSIRMLDDQRLERSDDLGVAAEGEVRIEAVLDAARRASSRRAISAWANAS